MAPAFDMQNRFHEFGRRRRLYTPGARIVVAVSGGIDSSVLLDLLASERKQMRLDLAVAHFNHGLRGEESEADERFVCEMAARYGFGVYVEHADTATRARQEKKGIQEMARILRYEFFFNLLESLEFDHVATAHNADDNAETILLHLLRGTGLRGLGGIPVERNAGTLIRPLVFAQRSDIETYANAAGIKYRNDSSNEEDHYRRNIIRHHILPPIREHINPSVSDTLLTQADLLQELSAYLVDETERVIKEACTSSPDGMWSVDVRKLLKLPTLLQRYLMREVLAMATGRTAEHATIEAVLGLQRLSTGAQVTLPGGWLACRDRASVVLWRESPAAEFTQQVEINHRYPVDCFEFFVEEIRPKERPESVPGVVEFVDADRLVDQKLILRTWHDGDWFVPLGMGERRKKISDYLIDRHVPLYAKKHYPVLTTESGDVVWLCGQRLDHRFRLTDATQKILKLVFARKEQVE